MKREDFTSEKNQERSSLIKRYQTIGTQNSEAESISWSPQA
jgi:hypothetical protein